MADTQFLRLSEKWALAYDNAQWIVQQARRNRNRKGGLEWRAIAFVATDKGVLHRVLREKGAVIDSEGHAALRRLPGTFREISSTKRGDRYADCRIRTGFVFDRPICYATGDRRWSSGESRLNSDETRSRRSH